MIKEIHHIDSASRSWYSFGCNLAAIHGLWLLFSFGTIFAFAAPGSEYNGPRVIWANLVFGFPLATLASLAILGSLNFVRRTPGKHRYVITMILMLYVGVIAYFMSLDSALDKCEWDDFGSEEYRQLIHAIATNDVHSVNDYVNGGGSVNFYGERGINPLYVALDKNNKQLVDLILQSGYDASVAPPSAYGASYFFVPIHLCTLVYHQRVSEPEGVALLERLLDAGLNPNIVVDGDPLLHHASRLDFCGGIHLLAKRGADLKRRNKSGETAFESVLVPFGSFKSALAFLDHVEDDELDRPTPRLRDIDWRAVGKMQPESRPAHQRFLAKLRERGIDVSKPK